MQMFLSWTFVVPFCVLLLVDNYINVIRMYNSIFISTVQVCITLTCSSAGAGLKIIIFKVCIWRVCDEERRSGNLGGGIGKYLNFCCCQVRRGNIN